MARSKVLLGPGELLLRGLRALPVPGPASTQDSAAVRSPAASAMHRGQGLASLLGIHTV